MLIRAEQRFRSEHDGIVSLHCFSAGSHYDPERMGVGALIGFDEHVLGPGAGFTEHAHRGVDIVSWVLAGELRHVGDGGELIVRPGQVLVQRSGTGMRHAEANASDHEPLRLLQMTLVGDDRPASVELVAPPVVTAQGRFSVQRAHACRLEPRSFVHVVAGVAHIDGIVLSAGDSLAPQRASTVVGDGALLLWELGPVA